MTASFTSKASNIITTTGTLEVCYDELGSQYKVPMYCFANPTELVASSSSGSSNSSGAQQQQQQNSGIPTASAVVGSAVGGAGATAQVVEATPLKLKVRINPGNLICARASIWARSVLRRQIQTLSVIHTFVTHICPCFLPFPHNPSSSPPRALPLVPSKGDINMMVNVDAGKSILDLKKSIVEQNIQVNLMYTSRVLLSLFLVFLLRLGIYL